MGGVGSASAIEASDIVIMNDDISRGKAVAQMKRIFSLCYDYNAH